MLVQAVNATQLEELVVQNDIVLVDFWGVGCAPCRQFEKVYEKVAAKHPSIIFTKINIASEMKLAETFNIKSIPHLLIFKRGIPVYSEAGSMSESMFKELVEQAINVNVDDIRTQIEQGDL